MLVAGTRDAPTRELATGSAARAAAQGGRPGPAAEVEVLDMRGRPGCAGPLHPRTRDALGASRRLAARRSCSSTGAGGRRSWTAARAAAHSGAPNATSRWSCTRGELRCHHCGHREPMPERVRRVRIGHASRGTAPEPSGPSDWSPSWWPRCRCSASTPTRGRDRRPRRDPPAIRQRARRGAAGDADGGEGPRLPGRDAGRGARRGRDAAVPGLPGRGAHLLAGRAAGGPQRPGCGRRAGARPDARARRRGDSPRGRSTTRRASWRASSSVAARCGTRRSPTSSGSS